MAKPYCGLTAVLLACFVVIVSPFCRAQTLVPSQTHDSGHVNDFESYALLAIPHYHLTTLLDTVHNYLNVRDDAKQMCYLIDLTISPRTALSLLSHLYRTGLEVLDQEFTQQGEVTQGELARILSSRHVHFCWNHRIITLGPTADTAGVGSLVG